MKNLAYLVMFSALFNPLIGQDIMCDVDNTISINSIVCNPGADINDPSDNYLSFVVTSSSLSTDIEITGLPDNTTVDMGSGDVIVSGTAHIYTNSDVSISAPSDFCNMLDLGFEFDLRGTSVCDGQVFSFAIVGPVIPTVGQWGIISLIILFLIGGVALVRTRRQEHTILN